MRIVVTGAAGFIGSWLSERLLALGHEVRGIDCLADYYSPDVKRNNIECARDYEQFTFLEQDLLEADLTRILGDCEIIFHLAAQAGVRTSWGQFFKAYTDNNILATQRLLDTAKGLPIKRFVFASSSSVYGNAKNMPIAEEEPTVPVSPYGVTKLAAENLCRLYHKSFDVPAIALRLFTVYGPRQRPDMAFHKFIRAILGGEPIMVFGSGEQTRDFTFVDDVVEACVLAMKEGREGAAYNIGGGARITLNSAIELLENMIGRKAERSLSASQKGDALHTWSDTARAKDELGFEPAHNVEEGLRKEVEWLRASLA